MQNQTTAPPLLLSNNLTISTNPSLTINSTSSVVVTITANTTVLCKQIVITVPTGSNADELFLTEPSININTSNWELSGQDVDPVVNPLAPSDASYSTYTLLNKTSGFSVSDTLSITFLGEINGEMGDVLLFVNEFSATTDTPTYSVKSGNYSLTKLPSIGFFVTNFMSALPSSPLLPCTQFVNDTPLMLSWKSNGTYFNIYAKGNSQPVYSGTATTCTITAGISTETTFILEAVSGSDKLYETLTLTVSNPDLVVNSIQSITDDSIGGNLKVMGTGNIANMEANSLTVTGQTTMNDVTVNGNVVVPASNNNDASLTIERNTNITGALTVLNAPTMNGSGVINSFSLLTEMVETNGLNVLGDATVEGHLNVGFPGHQIVIFNDMVSGDLIFNLGGRTITFKAEGKNVTL